MARQIVLDTETTGLEWRAGHRVIEIGAVEVLDRKLTGRHYHQYINPQREIDAGAQEIHGISLESLQDKPVFETVMTEFIDFIKGAELVIHNASFDVGFLDNEFKLCGAKQRVEKLCGVVDSLQLARMRHPGQKNNLDALCKRYMVDNSQRDLHGALLDAEILADVYLVMTGGQTALSLSPESSDNPSDLRHHKKIARRTPRPVVNATAEELVLHEQRLTAIDKAADLGCVWRQTGTLIAETMAETDTQH